MQACSAGFFGAENRRDDKERSGERERDSRREERAAYTRHIQIITDGETPGSTDRRSRTVSLAPGLSLTAGSSRPNQWFYRKDRAQRAALALAFIGTAANLSCLAVGRIGDQQHTHRKDPRSSATATCTGTYPPRLTNLPGPPTCRPLQTTHPLRFLPPSLPPTLHSLTSLLPSSARGWRVRPTVQRCSDAAAPQHN
ncbi:hypothetical protein F5144DRAFT_578380 [Chaetomium tenue]|uniref:Uncharacterized protein n=1 Tax=Chaetomium tenue TaxID=1854479 RepID=A0ACB7P3H7_9PEZI|nr:hypothetical protein F5144DRAFT_578380 [Chaetomium globosum]